MTRYARPVDWPERLALFIQEYRRQPFAWGVLDCALFAADWLIVLGYPDFAHHLRGQYHTRLGAARMILTMGCRSVLELPGAFNLEEIDQRLAGRGDLVAVEFAREGKTLNALAVCAGAHAFAPGLAGLVGLPRKQWIRAWRT